MEVKLIFAFFIVHSSVFAGVISEGDFEFETEANASVDDVKFDDVDSKIHENRRRFATIQRDADDEFSNLENSRENELLFERDNSKDSEEEKHRKILKFGVRVMNSVNEHGLLKEEMELLKTGDYRIDWWKNDRRMERIRNRLSEELERQPRLKNRLENLRWKNPPEEHSPEKNHDVDKPTNDEKPSGVPLDNRRRNTILRKIMTMAFRDLVNFDFDKITRETPKNRPTVFIFMNIILSKPDEIEENENIATNEIPDSPMKFSLNTRERAIESSRNDEITSERETTSSSREAQTTGPNYPLQLIPLIVDELREGRVDDNERRSLSWIYGKRLWRLIEDEATKKSDETMDKDLAVFIIKGELPERNGEAENPRRRPLGRSIIAMSRLKNDKTEE